MPNREKDGGWNEKREAFTDSRLKKLRDKERELNPPISLRKEWEAYERSKRVQAVNEPVFSPSPDIKRLIETSPALEHRRALDSRLEAVLESLIRAVGGGKLKVHLSLLRNRSGKVIIYEEGEFLVLTTRDRVDGSWNPSVAPIVVAPAQTAMEDYAALLAETGGISLINAASEELQRAEYIRKHDTRITLAIQDYINDLVSLAVEKQEAIKAEQEYQEALRQEEEETKRQQQASKPALKRKNFGRRD